MIRDIKENFGTQVFIAVTGGEPLLYDKFFELMEFVHDEEFRWGMTSNATLITPELLFRPDVKPVKIVPMKNGARAMRFTVGIMKKMSREYV